MKLFPNKNFNIMRKYKCFSLKILPLPSRKQFTDIVSKNAERQEKI